MGPVHLFGYPGFDGWVVERLPPESSHVIAQSMGGVLAARLAVEKPDRVARLVVVPGGTHAFATERPAEVASIIRSHLM